MSVSASISSYIYYKLFIIKSYLLVIAAKCVPTAEVDRRLKSTYATTTRNRSCSQPSSDGRASRRTKRINKIE